MINLASNEANPLSRDPEGRQRSAGTYCSRRAAERAANRALPPDLVDQLGSYIAQRRLKTGDLLSFDPEIRC